MTAELLQVTVELPQRPIGTHFTYSPRTYKVKHDAEIVGYRLEHNTDSGTPRVSYRIAYDFAGQRMTTDVPTTTVERALWDQA